jgi:hypothetical protein
MDSRAFSDGEEGVDDEDEYNKKSEGIALLQIMFKQLYLNTHNTI